MAESKIVGYKNIFGFVLPDWVDEATIRMMVTFLLSSAVMFFVLIFVIWPKFADISKLRASLLAKQTQLNSLLTSKSGFDKLNEQIPESSQNLILQAIPQTYSPESAIFLLRNIANNTLGVSIVSYSLPAGVLFDTSKASAGGTSDALASFVGYPIRITVSAPIDALLSFINKVETSLPFGVVSDLGMQEVSKLSKSVGGDKSIKVDLEIKYYQAVLKQVDITKISTITDQDLSVLKDLSSYTQYNKLVATEEASVTSNPSGSLFGF